MRRRSWQHRFRYSIRMRCRRRWYAPFPFSLHSTSLTDALVYLSFFSFLSIQKKLNVEIAELEARAAERREAASRREAAARLEAEEALNVVDTGADMSLGLEAADISMEGITV
jgi:hypothetical protein